MEIKHAAIAGTVESSDAMITVEKSNDGITIDISSPVIHQYGNQIRRIALETLKSLDVKNVNMSILDKGALDCTLKARIQSAVFRAADCSEKDIKWEEL